MATIEPQSTPPPGSTANDPPTESTGNPPLESTGNPPESTDYPPPAQSTGNPPPERTGNSPLESTGNPPESTGNPPPESTGNPPPEPTVNSPLESTGNPPPAQSTDYPLPDSTGIPLKLQTKYDEALKRCNAYDNLHTKLGNQCLRYRAFYQNELLGSIPGMYKINEFGEKIPNGLVSDYFRGGIISTIAIFEAFIVDLLEEACELCTERCKLHCEYKKEAADSSKKDGGKKDGGKKQDDTKKCKKYHIIPEIKKQAGNKNPQATPLTVQFHSWSSEYARVLIEGKEESAQVPLQDKEIDKTFTDYLFRSFPDSAGKTNPTPITYTYIIEEQHYSEVKIGTRRRTVPFDEKLPYRRQQRKLEDEGAICAIFRLFYGIRCVMAHGNSEKTLNNGNLKNFPYCSQCNNTTLEDSMDLVIYLEKCITNIGPSEGEKVDNDIRRIPTKVKFNEIKENFHNSLEEDEWTDVFKIIDKHFPTPTNDTPYTAAFAYFHMCRTLHWLRKTKSNMYITYRLLVRINQFIHMLAFRIHIAVAEILMKEHKLQNGTWGINIEENGNNGNIDGMIGTFEKKHKEFVKTTHPEVQPVEDIDEWMKTLTSKKIENWMKTQSIK